MRTLVIVTTSYPYVSVTEASFIEPEIEALSNAFDRVIILPCMRGNIDALYSLPWNVIVSDELLLPSGIYPRIEGMLSNTSNILKAFTNCSNPIRETVFNAYVGMVKKGFRKFIRNNSIDLNSTLFYTFWFDFQTAALSEIEGVKFISRAHGYDIFENGRGYISRYWRIKTLKKIVALHPASDSSSVYLARRYPEFRSKISTRRLGSRQFGSLNPSGRRDDIVCYGCARLSPEKGVIAQVKMLMRLASENPGMHIEYHHIGDGVLMDEFKILSKNTPDNIEIIIHGAMRNEDVHKFLSSTHIDFTLLLSDSEGGCPISICESLSYGVPVIASDVGGVPETLSDGGGIVLVSPVRFEDFVDAIHIILEDSESLRKKARLNWEKNFSAQTLRENFAKELSGLIPAV